ncbi:UNVERIFIED_CONTAM: hypothetical protein RMT77_013428 [Armadillidium vulgare]
MSKYFSFLRKKRNPSLRDEETEIFSSKSGGRKRSGVRKSSTPQAQKLSTLSTSSASLSSQTGDENRHSTYSLDSCDLKEGTVIDPFQSDSDSLLDNASVEGGDTYPVDEDKRVAVEAEFENDILESASEVFEKVGVIKHAVCTYVEEEDEGHVIEYNEGDDDDDNLIDDFMDEALYDLEDNVSTNVIVEDGKEDTCFNDKSPEDPASQCSSKNMEEESSNSSTREKNSMGSIAHDDIENFDGDKENVERVKVLPSCTQEMDSTECSIEKLVDISGETPEEEDVGVEVSSTEEALPKGEICSKEMSYDLLFKASESEKEMEKDFDTVGELEHKHSDNNCTKDESKNLIQLDSSDSSGEVLLCTDENTTENRLSANSIINEDEGIKLVFPAKTGEEAGNNLLIGIPNVCVEKDELTCRDFDQKISEDSVSEAKQLKNEDEGGGGGGAAEEPADVYESLKFGEVMSINLTSIEREFLIEDVEEISNNQSEDENQVNKIEHIDNQEETPTNNCDNLKDSDETGASCSNNNNSESLMTDHDFVAKSEDSSYNNLVDSAEKVSSNEVWTKDETDMEDLSDELILNAKNTESKDTNLSDVDDDDEFDSAKEDFSNEEDDTFNERDPVSVVSSSGNEENEDSLCPVITENFGDECDQVIGIESSSVNDLIPPVDSPGEINATYNDDKTLTVTEILADNDKETLTLSTPEESTTLENIVEHVDNETLETEVDQLDNKALKNQTNELVNEEAIVKTNLDLKNNPASTNIGDLITTESSETLSLLLSSASTSKYSLLNRRNSSSSMEVGGVPGGNRRRSSISESSNHRFIECGERNFRKSLSQQDDREQILEEPSKKIQSVNEDSFLLTTVNADHQKAEAKLAQRRAARAEARELRLRELEKQQQQEQQENNEEEEQYAASSYSHEPPVSRTPSAPRTRSSVPVNSLSRMSSEDSLPDDHLPSSARELKADLQELEEKFRKAMVLNAQLDNEKATLMYEVEFLKDKYTDLEEAHIQLTKEHKKKSSENEQLRKLSNKLKEEVRMVRRVLQERDELIQEYGLVLIGEENGEESYDDMEDEERTSDTIMDLSPRKIGVKKALLSQEASELLSKGAAKGSLDVRLRKYAEDKHELEDEVRRLKLVLEEELSNKRRENGLDYEKHKETTKSLNEFKFKIQKAEAEVSTLQANVARLESLVARYKASTEELEKSEEELKSEKRRLQRELREVKERCDELETSKAYVKRQYEKLLHERGRVYVPFLHTHT